jgi:hypothetical protein
VGLGWLVNAYSSHSIPQRQGGRLTKDKRVISHDAKGLIPKMQGEGSASEPGRIMEVAMWLCVPLLLGL